MARHFAQAAQQIRWEALEITVWRQRGTREAMDWRTSTHRTCLPRTVESEAGAWTNDRSEMKTNWANECVTGRDMDRAKALVGGKLIHAKRDLEIDQRFIIEAAWKT